MDLSILIASGILATNTVVMLILIYINFIKKV